MNRIRHQGLGQESGLVPGFYDIKAVFILVFPLLALLLSYLLGPLTPITVLLSVLIFSTINYRYIISTMKQNWLLLLLPIYCLTSAIWSAVPAATLRYGSFYLITVVFALLLGSSWRRIAILQALQISLSIYLTMAVFLGRWVLWQDGSYAFAGLAGSKNAAADYAGIGVLISLVVLSWAVGKRRLWWALIALLTFPMAMYCLIFAKSTGAMLTTALAAVCLILWIASRRMSTSNRIAIFAFSIFAGAMALASAPIWADEVFETVLQQSGKDRDLTGRIDLWRVADKIIIEHPFVGIGYSAFWNKENLDAIKLWRLLGIPIGNPFNFHSTPRAIAAEVGLIGLILFTIIWTFSAIRLFLSSMFKPDYSSIFFCSIIIFVLPRLFFEVLGFTNMHITTVIVFAACAAGLAARRQLPRAARQPRR